MITSGHISIGTASTLIDGTHNSNFRLWIKNADNTDTVFIGNSTVTVDNGLGIGKEQFIEIEMNPLEELHAVSTKAGHIIHWMKQV